MYRVVIDDLVLKKDFKKIDLQDQRKILRVIRRKLTMKPKDYGIPLRAGLEGFRKLKVGESRVIYEIEEDQVLVYVIIVGFRRDEEMRRAALLRLGLA